MKLTRGQTQLVMALHHLKNVGIIHLDIKPMNVTVVERHEKPLREKLVDVGGAQTTGSTDFETFIFTPMCSPLLLCEISEAVDLRVTTFLQKVRKKKK